MINHKTIQRRTQSLRRFGVLLFILLAGFQTSVPMNEEAGGILFPRGIGFTVGQVGWMEGSSLDDEGGPWRAGMKRYVHNIGTYNVYSVTEASDRLEIDIKMYGCQIVEIRSPEPRSVHSSNSGLFIRSMTYDPSREMVILTLEGKDIQGERGTII